MANDGDLSAVQPGGNAPPPPAPDAQKKSKANADLFKAIEGSGISRKARKKIYANGKDISDTISNLPDIVDDDGKKKKDFADTGALPDGTLDKWRLIDASEFFGSGENYDGPKSSTKGKMARAVNAVIYRNRAKLQAEAAKADETRLAIKVAIASDILLEKTKAEEDAKNSGDDRIRYSNTRRRYLELADGLFNAGRYQKGFEQLENARTLRRIADLDAKARDRLGDNVRKGDNPRAADKVKRETSHPLGQKFADLQSRRAALATRSARIQKLCETALDAGDKRVAEIRALAASGLKEVPEMVVLEDPPAPDAKISEHEVFDKLLNAHSASLTRWTAVLDTHEKKLDAFDGIGTKEVKALHDAAVKKFKDLVHFDDGAAQRDGANVDGIGVIAMHSKSKDIPQEIIRRVAAQVEALEYISAGENMTAEQYRAAKAMADEATAAIKDAKENRKTYSKITKALDRVEKLLGSEEFKNRENRKEYHREQLEALRESMATGLLDQDDEAVAKSNDPEKVKAAAKERLAKVEVSLYHAYERAEQFEDLLEYYDKSRKKAVERHAKLIVQIAKLPGGADELGGAAKKKKNWVKMLKTYGDIAERFDAEWAKVDMGDSKTYTPTRTAIGALADTIGKELDDLEAAVKTVTTTIEDKTSDPKDIKSWLEKNKGGAGDGALIQHTLDGLSATAAEVARVDELKDSFDDTRKEMRKFIRNNKGGFTLDPRVNIRDRKERGKVEKDMRQAFENYNFMLEALKARGEVARTVEEWKDLDREMKATKEKIMSFADDHRPPSGKEKKRGQEELAALVIETACRDLRDFEMDTRGLIARICGREKDAAQKAWQADAGNADAKAVYDIIETREATLRAFADRVLQIADTSKLAPVADLLRTKPNDNAQIALREQALAQLRRKRAFLEESGQGILMRANPIDMGAAASALALSLSAAEAKLLTLVKRG